MSRNNINNVYNQSELQYTLYAYFCGTFIVCGSTMQRIRVRPWQLLTKVLAEEKVKGESRNYGNASEWIHRRQQQGKSF